MSNFIETEDAPKTFETPYIVDLDTDFIGRIDFQVKIRGFRIEPEEIARSLEEHPALVRALVMVESTSRGDQELVAYAVPEPSATLSAVTGST